MEELLHTLRPIVPFINFIIFAVIVYFVGRTFLGKSAQKYREDFLKQFEETNRIKKDADDSLRALETRIQAFDAELSQIRENTEKVAKLQAEQILQQAQSLSKNMIHEARITIEAETKQASETLKSLLANKLHAKTVDKFATNLTSDKQHEIIKSQAKLLPSAQLKH